MTMRFLQMSCCGQPFLLRWGESVQTYIDAHDWSCHHWVIDTRPTTVGR